MVVWVGKIMTRRWFQIFFIFNPTWGKISNLTSIFQRGWNHQPDDPWESSLLNDPLLYGMWNVKWSRPRRSCVFRCPWVVVLLPCLVIHIGSLGSLGRMLRRRDLVELMRKSGNCSVILLEKLCNSLGWFQVSNDDWVVVSPYVCEFSHRSLRKWSNLMRCWEVFFVARKIC